MSVSIGGSGLRMGPGYAMRRFGRESETESLDVQVVVRLLAYLRPHWKRMVVALMLMLTASALTLTVPYLIKVAIDVHIAAGDEAGLVQLSLFTDAAFLGIYCAEFGQRYLLSWVGQRVLFTLRNELFEHLQALSLGYHDTHIIGVTISRVMNDVGIINELLSHGLIRFIGDLMILAGIVGVMVTMSPRLALLTFSVLPVMLLITYLFTRRARVAFRKTRARIAAVVADLAEDLAGMRVIQAFAHEDESLESFDEVNRANRDAYIEAMSLSFVFLPSVEESLLMLWRDTYDAMVRQAGGPTILDLVTPALLSDLSTLLLDMGAKIVGFKLGHRGFYVRTAARAAIAGLGAARPADPEGWAGKEIWAPVFEVDVVGATGAGDATIAGFLTAMLRGLSLEDAVTAAVAVGACSVEAADGVGGVRSWDDTWRRVQTSWARGRLNLDQPGWRYDNVRGHWVGPAA